VYAFVRAFRVRRQVKSARVFETQVARGRGLETDIYTRIVSSEPALCTYLIANRVRDALVIKSPLDYANYIREAGSGDGVRFGPMHFGGPCDKNIREKCRQLAKRPREQPSRFLEAALIR